MLSISPALLERYLSAARKSAGSRSATRRCGRIVESYKVSSQLVQDDRVSEDLPFGSRGGIAIRHYFPLDGEYRFASGCSATCIYNIRGLAEPQQLDLRVDGVRVKMLHRWRPGRTGR